MFRYRYSEKDNSMIYDGDLGGDLITFGVCPKHILDMKNTVVKDIPEFILDCEGKEHPQLVPLSKVVGFSRGAPGKTIFENVQATACDQRDSRRLADCLSYLQRYGNIQELFSSYEEMDVRIRGCAVRMYHEKKNDEYYVMDNGNHRTLIAKLAGAPYIQALVTEAVVDDVKTERIRRCRSIYAKYSILIIKMVYINVSKVEYQIIFDNNGNSFQVVGYKDILSQTDIDKRIASFSEALHRDFRLVERAKQLGPIGRTLFLGTQRPEVRQLFRQHTPAKWYRIYKPDVFLFLPN